MVQCSIRFNEKIKAIFEIQQPGIVLLGRTIQCPYFQEHPAWKGGPARETKINLDKFRGGK
jgi:hypothetical protein